MIRTHRFALLGVALLAMASTQPAMSAQSATLGGGDGYAQVGGHVVPKSQARQAQNCQAESGTYDAAAGVCDTPSM
jgi:hypothetical protein